MSPLRSILALSGFIRSKYGESVFRWLSRLDGMEWGMTKWRKLRFESKHGQTIVLSLSDMLIC
jgi:hypothetical protein